MKTWPALAVLLVLAVAPSWAQEQPAPDQDDKVQLELAELEQDVDKTLLREAMLLLGRKGLMPSSERPTSDEDRRREAEDAHQLEEYIQRKKQALIERSAELKKIRAKTTTEGSKPATPPAEADKQRLIEKLAKAEVEVQMLRREIERYRRAAAEPTRLGRRRLTRTLSGVSTRRITRSSSRSSSMRRRRHTGGLQRNSRGCLN